MFKIDADFRLYAIWCIFELQCLSIFFLPFLSKTFLARPVKFEPSNWSKLFFSHIDPSFFSALWNIPCLCPQKFSLSLPFKSHFRAKFCAKNSAKGNFSIKKKSIFAWIYILNSLQRKNAPFVFCRVLIDQVAHSSGKIPIFGTLVNSDLIKEL